VHTHSSILSAALWVVSIIHEDGHNGSFSNPLKVRPRDREPPPIPGPALEEEEEEGESDSSSEDEKGATISQ
jgi:hypothetical protein